MKLSDDFFRDSLPLKEYEYEKINFWKILQDAMGKDLTKFALPVTFNEPLSVL